MTPAPVALLTGFAPFRHWAVNSSGAAARMLSAARPALAARILPVDHREAGAALDAALAAVSPDIALLTGLADEPCLRLERAARRPVHEGGAEDGDAAALHGVWPWAVALDAIRATGAPARLSQDAGRYVCETVYWRGLSAPRRPRLVAFLHVPPIGPDWPAARIAAAVAACLDAALGAAQNASSPAKSIASK